MSNATKTNLARHSWFLGDVDLDPKALAVDPGLVIPATAELVLRRPDDLVVLHLRLHNLIISGPAGARRVAPDDTSKPAYLAVYHPPQSCAEQAFVDTSPTDLPTPLAKGSLPAGFRQSGRSRVVHRFPPDLLDWDGSSAGLLSAMANWPLERVPLRLPSVGGLFSGFERLTELGRTLSVLSANPDIASRVDRTVRRTARSIAALTPDAASEAASSIGDAVARIADDARLSSKATGEVVQAAELQLAGRLGNSFVDKIGIQGVIGAIPGLRLLFKPRPPTELETAIELPYRLALSPLDDQSVFSHSVAPVTRGTWRPRTELWHSRLGTQRDGAHVDATEESVPVAAIWSPDLIDPGNDPPFLASLTKEDRIALVHLTADETLTEARGGRPYHPTPAFADRLMLTALGGWLDVEGKWTTHPRGIDLSKWSHHAAMGRDYLVEVVNIGHLLPCGHRAATLQLTERRFEPHPNGGRVASLRKQLRIVLLEPLLSFPAAGQPAQGRELPFTAVEVLTRKTPKLLFPVFPEDFANFWPQVQVGAAASDFRFAVRATDLSGSPIRFDLPMRFVAEASTGLASAVAAYNGGDQSVPNRTTAPLANQIVQLAPGPGPVAFPIKVLRFATSQAPGWAPDTNRRRVFPSLKAITLVSTEIGQITGAEGAGEFGYAQPWINHGFAAGNDGEVFLATTAQPLKADLGGGGKSDSTGGFVTPSFGVVGMSRLVGHIGGGGPTDAVNFATAGFQPNTWFPSAKIFGGVDLKDILAPVAVALAGKIPKLKTVRSPDKITTSFEHIVEKLPDKVTLLRLNKGGTSTFEIKVSVTAFLKVADNDPALNHVGSGPGNYARDAGLKDPEAEAFAKLTFFKFDFFGSIVVSFDHFAFTAKTGKGFDPDPKLASTDPVVFGGPLTFLETLRKSVFGGGKSAAPAPGGGGAGAGAGGGGVGGGGAKFGFKPIIKLEDGGLTAGGKFGVPSVQVGVFALKNVMASAVIKIPFDGRSVGFVFGFAERSNPFQLTVSLFGGGGFVLLGLDAEGVQEIEAALEFGAFAEIDLGIASGGIYVKGGFYFHWKNADHTTVFVGYVEMGGEVQALGIISVSIVLNLSLGFYKQGSTSLVKGQAVLTIEVEVLFFSVSASVTVERSFAGSESDPRFIDFIPNAAVWKAYADAFA
jgi:hypothetical protein